MRRTIRRTTVAGLAVATLALASACGSSSNASGDHAKESSSGSSAASGGGETGLAAGSALNAVDAKSVMTSAVNAMTSMKISGDISVASSGTIHMEGVEQAKPSLRAEITESIDGQDMDVRMIGSNMYIQMPSSASAGLPAGKKWMSVNFSDLGSLTGMDTSTLSQSMEDPASAVSKYAKYVTGGKYVGSESVDGTTAKHYTFTVDMKSATADMLPNGVPSSAAGELPASMTEDVWVDGDGHPVQIKVDLGKLGVTTMHMSDFGTKVSVTAPPADQVADMKQLMGQLGGAAQQ